MRARIRIWLRLLSKDQKGQDMVEYALMAGFLAVAAGAVLPSISSSIQTIMSLLMEILFDAARV